MEAQWKGREGCKGDLNKTLSKMARDPCMALFVTPPPPLEKRYQVKFGTGRGKTW